MIIHRARRRGVVNVAFPILKSQIWPPPSCIQCYVFHVDKHCDDPEQGARGSVKRQSEIQREKKKSRQEEREEEKARKASYYRKVTGGVLGCRPLTNDGDNNMTIIMVGTIGP